MKSAFWDNGQLVLKSRFLWDKMAILSPIGLKIGFPIILTSYDGHTKLKLCNSKIEANMPINWPIISRAATFRRTLDGHNSAIFYPILTFKYTKMISSARRIDWWKDLSSISFRLDFHILSHFLPPVATWTTMAIGFQNHTQIVSNWYTYHAQLITQNRYIFLNPYNTPPLKLLLYC